jgi:hypothetical protein
LCICFGHPTKKTSLCEALHGRATMVGVGASMEGHGELAGEGGEGEGEERDGAQLGSARGGC